MKPRDISEGSGGQFALNTAARVWSLYMRETSAAMPEPACPSSPPVRVSYRPGGTCCPATLQPNPRFYEAIMGWPIGWTAPGEPVTGFAAWLQRSRGQFSNLLTSFQTGSAEQ